MLIGLYLITPFCKVIVKDDKLLKYFIFLWLVFEVLINDLKFIPVLQNISKIKDLLQLKCVSGYVGYYLLGYFLTSRKFIQNNKQIFYMIIIGFLAFLSTIWGTKILNLDNEFKQNLYGAMHTNIFIYSLSLFLIVCYLKDKIKLSEKTNNIILSFGKASFGIYLIHAFFISIVVNLKLVTNYIDPWFSIPILALIVFFASYLSVIVIGKIPYLKKIVL